MNCQAGKIRHAAVILSTQATSMNRRRFIKQSVITATGLYLAPKFAIGKAGASANSKINVACVGIGNMGNAAVHSSKEENIVALCDVDWRSDWGAHRNPNAVAAAYPKARRFEDFRDMLDKMGKEIDAVCVSTADHTHFPIGMAAMEQGKHLFIQKPLAHNIWQTRTLQAAAKKYGVQTVMGNQGHCFEGMRRIVEWYNYGILGEVREVHCWTDRPRAPWFPGYKSIPPATSPVPKGLNWDLWQGPVPDEDYSDEYIQQTWRGWWKFGCGSLGDIGCHLLDAPMWALQLGSPTKIEIAEMDGWENPYYTPKGAHLIYHFPKRGKKPPVKIHWHEGEFRPEKPEGMDELPTNGMLMIGSKETLYHEDMRPGSPMLWPRSRMQDHKEKLKIKTLDRSLGDPWKELYGAIRGEIPSAGSNFDYAAPLTEVVLLGAMAIRANQTLRWNARKMRTNSKAANAWIKEPVREGWVYGEHL